MELVGKHVEAFYGALHPTVHGVIWAVQWGHAYIETDIGEKYKIAIEDLKTGPFGKIGIYLEDV
jgi:hypothetical protein